MPGGVGRITFSADTTRAVAEITGGTLTKGRHVYSLVLVNRETGKALPLYYTKRTAVLSSPYGRVTPVSVAYERGEVTGTVKAYLMVDTYPAARGTVTVE
ncbi:MAG: hypothetical protein E4G96_10835 [Chrysiogenales bacterium]|nr:MAG: hypothetical protein E4G96_10835 [Chrysiogenales bacterium]